MDSIQSLPTLRQALGIVRYFKIVVTGAVKPTELDLKVIEKDGKARLQLTDKLCLDAGLHEIPHDLPTDKEKLEDVLRGVAAFFWNLRRTASDAVIGDGPFQPTGCTNLVGILRRAADFFGHLRHKICDNSESLSNGIVLEYYKLEKTRGHFKPKDGRNLLVGDNVNVEVVPGSGNPRYGICIKNTTDYPIFVSVFYFDMSDLRVKSYYEPPSAGQGGHFAPLRPAHENPDHCLTIGYGSGGARPQYFDLDGDSVDVGYIKLFLSTEYVDYHGVAQDSPFESKRHSLDDDESDVRCWDTKVISVIQRPKQVSKK